jgi:proton-dependent oligopeptide transporter, POT family
MFTGHPRGLIAASLSNMGERFGFYTMMAILVLFLQAKFGLTGKNAGIIYSIFYASIYILALVGGIIADRTRNYKGTISVGIILMGLGYLLMALPSETPVVNKGLYMTLSLAGLFTIAFGNGLFKGNLQALVGQMYDNETYKEKRDNGFSIFYMFINIGAIFAPIAAIGVRNWWLKSHSLSYNAELPALCHSYLGGTANADAIASLQAKANEVSQVAVTDLTAFSNNYLNIFTEGFHYAFAVAILAMIVSLVIFLTNKNRFPNPKALAKKSDASQASKDTIQMDIAEVRQRVWALMAVYGIVIFFWLSFHQNGLTLTFFARDYTLLKLGSWDITVELFQSLNPFFVVFLTPLVIALFSYLKNKGKEPSTPKKIAIGMFIAALGYFVMTLGSLGLPLFETIDPTKGGAPLADAMKVGPYLLLGVYFILTVAELFISPLGLSFVSKVAPPQYQGLMQGGWLSATAIGNSLLFVGAVFYESIPLWTTWSLFVIACLLSMTTMLFMLKWLERIAK